MDRIKLDLLLRHRESIVDDLDVDYIVDGLVVSECFNIDDIACVQSSNTRPDKVRKLLDLIPLNGTKAFDIFVDLLKKDYSWLWDKLQVTDDYVPRKVLRDTFEDSLSRGDVPRLPIHYVSRAELETTVHRELSTLQRYNVLVLHGMAGSGKSSLAISTLRNNPDLVFDSFNGYIFWINVGDCKTHEQIVDIQSRIYKKLLSSECFRESGSFDAVSVFSNDTSFPSTSNERVSKEYQEQLKQMFNKYNFQKSLLIIDDLKSKDVADAFDIGCKTLITTQDSTFVTHLNPTVLSVNENLTEQESLQLIASCVSQDVLLLPPQAKKLHHLCKGVPLWMAMLGGMLENDKEALVHDVSHWNDFIKQLKNKENFISAYLKGTSGVAKPYLTLKMCINSLKNKNLIKTYKSLVVLPDNAKVSTKALSVIMNMQEKDVEQLMKQLKKKSLIIEHYDVDLKSYQYEMHDLISSYLKSIHTKEDQQRLHASLIRRYRDACPEQDLVNLPDDGYIAHYISYHLLNTNNTDNMWSYFNTLFTNLTFIGNKIRLTGPTNLMEDFNLHLTERIVKKASEKLFLTELQQFIQNHGHDLHSYPNTDIVQSILQHEQAGAGCLYERAHNLAREGDNRRALYLQFECEGDVQQQNYTKIDVQDTVCVVRLWLSYLLLGNLKGVVTLWSIETNKRLKTFNGHIGPIRSISVNYSTPLKMATTGEDGVLKIWDTDDCCDDQSEDTESIENGDHFLDSHHSLLTLVNEEGPYCGGYWGNESDVILTHTNPGKSVILYNTQGNQVVNITTEANTSIISSVLSLDDSLIIFGTAFIGNNKSFRVHVYSVQTKDLLMSFIEHAPILLLTIIPSHPRCVLVLTTVHLIKHEWSEIPHPNQTRSVITDSKIANIEELQNEYHFETGCVATDGSCIFISTTDFRILVYNFDTSSLVWELNNCRGVIVSMDVMGSWNSADMTYFQLLITKSNEDTNTVKLWCVASSQISPPPNVLRKAKLSLKFDSTFDKPMQISPVTPTELQHMELVPTSVRRAQTFGQATENGHKTTIRKTTSLDRQAIKPLNLKNCSNLVSESGGHPLIAVIDNSNKVQILRGKKLLAETPTYDNQITAVALSRCGLFLVYGLETGVIYKFILFSKKNSKIMDLNAVVNYLEFLNFSTLVAAGKTTGLMVYEFLDSSQGESNAKMLISPGEFGSQDLIDDINGRKKNRLDSQESLKKCSPTSLNSFNILETNSTINRRAYPRTDGTLFKRSPIIKCYWLEGIGLLSVCRNSSTKIWDLTPQVLSILICKQTDFDVSSVTLQNDNLLVLCDYSGKFQIYTLQKKTDDNALSAILFDSSKLLRRITSCCVSVDSKILAFGLDNGDIVLRHIPGKMIITTLSLHKSAVRCLRFSPGLVLSPDPKPLTPFSPKTFNFNFSEELPNGEEKKEDSVNDAPMVLVSLAGQIVWWNISHILSTKLQAKRRSKGPALQIISPRTPVSISDLSSFSGLDGIFKTDTNQNGSSNNFTFPNIQWQSIWRGKRYKNHTDRKEVLACIRLVGDGAINVAVDEKFSKFVTIDQCGTLYIMNVLDNNSNSCNGA